MGWNGRSIKIRIAAASTLINLVSCSVNKNASPKTADPFRPSENATVKYYAPEKESFFDKEGYLLESGERFYDLAVPVGLTPQFKSEKERMYLSKVPISALRKYFMSRLVPGRIDTVGEGYILHRATPIRSNKPMPLEVSILPTRGALARVTITKVGYASGMSEAELRARLDREQKTLE